MEPEEKEEKKTVRRGAGRGRRPPTSQPAPPGHPQEEPSSPSAEAGHGRGQAISKTPERESGSPDGQSSKGSPTGSDVDEKLKQLQVLDLAKRPGFGVVGKKHIKVIANYFEVKLEKALLVCQYRIEVTHLRLKLNRDEKREAFFLCVTANRDIFPSVYRIVFDGDSMALGLDNLKLGRGDDGSISSKFEIGMVVRRTGQQEKIMIKVQLTGRIQVEPRDARVATERYTTPLHVLDLIVRQNRSYPLNPEMVNKWYPFKNTIFKIPEPGGGGALTCGRVTWMGLFGACRIGQDFIPYINFDVAHSAFYRQPQGVLQYMIEVLNYERPMGYGGYKLESMNSDTQMTSAEAKSLHRALKGVRVHFSARTVDGHLVERDYVVDQVNEANAVNCQFVLKSRSGDEDVSISVADYFATRYGQLRYPRLSVLQVGPRRKTAYVPMEHCFIVPNQRVSKLRTADTAQMIKNTASDAPRRMGEINNMVGGSNFGLDYWCREFGVTINDKMKTVDARILEAPKIRYAGQAISSVDEGVWKMGKDKKFLVPGSCQQIAALIMDQYDTSSYMGFFSQLLKVCHDLGMRIPLEINLDLVRILNPNEVKDIEPAMTALKQAGAQFIIVTLPQKSSVHYCEVKRVAEIVLGIMTQCLVKSNIEKCIRKQDTTFMQNIALKMNTKMAGVNSETEPHSLAQKVLLEEPTLVLGIDVTHPPQADKRMPSIASVVGNIDASFMRYAASVRLQRHRRETLVSGHLHELVRDRLMDYHKYVSAVNKAKNLTKPTKPTRIIVWRDGVAEGDFEKVLKEELGGVRQCLKELSHNAKITFIVAQKRHHTRFFPGPGGPHTLMAKAVNIIPGTVVDRDITHPELFEFYLCSHQGIQGTSRPIRYHVLHDDSGFTADHIQVVAFHLCHNYARCTRTVSIPAPLYYADLSCRRARAHIFDKVSDFGSDTLSQTGTGDETGTGVSEDELINASTVRDDIRMRMYFV